ncbi:MAG TPA: TAT-variant-translocated molybdopterin oxidoreductase [Candidatus Binatia bacterium]
MNGKKENFDSEGLLAPLSGLTGREYWRSLEELADSPVFYELLQKESPRHAALWFDAIDRRDFLKVMAASLALAAGCRSAAPAPTDEKIVPYVNQPEEIVPGKPLYYATAMPLCGFGHGVIAESHTGRPTKIEGNPQHPSSLGGSHAFIQASILGLYDPDRSRVLSHAGQITTWNTFFSALNAELEGQRLNQGAGLRVLTETVTSPTLASQLQQLLRAFPKAKWHQYEPTGRDGVRDGSRMAFGEVVETVYRFDKADVIVSLDADFLFAGPGSVRYARDFANRRRMTANAPMNRLYVIESTFSVTGSVADHRLALRPSEIEPFTAALAGALGVSGNRPASLTAVQNRWIQALSGDLKKRRGSSIVIAGEEQPASVHALVHTINQALGNTGNTVVYTESIEAQPINQIESLRDLVGAMDTNQVQVLLILGGNPVYTAPSDLNFSTRLVKSNLSVHLSLYEDETSALCHWHVPQAHYLESWSDVRGYDGTAAIIQPLIAPLYGGRTAHELLAAVMGQPGRSSYEIVQDYWKSWRRGGDFEQFWRRALHDGVVSNTAAPTRPVHATSAAGLKSPPITAAPAGRATPGTEANSGIENSKSKIQNGLEIVFRPDPTILDGRFANNAWLQETPKPLTKLTWDNAVLISPATAARFGLEQRVGTTGGEHGMIHTDVVELTLNGQRIRGPAWILPGHADGCVTVHLGYGRARAGRVGSRIGFDVNPMRTSANLWQASGVELRKTGDTYALACTQFHHLMEGRNLARETTIDEYRKNPKVIQEMDSEEETPSLYPDYRYEGYAWGMAIDINSCIGCNACVVACQAENNIPSVGKEEVLRGREMHWIRIDRYYKGPASNPEVLLQPLPCMQCENAPCELVCPVHATTHSHEGLNDMTYNRCVGTRYCSNNCPYKVRRFNFFQYSDYKTDSIQLLHNPNVTVRSRGVMEKCTYCVQRINNHKIEAEREDRTVRDGEIVTACQQACPTQAIVFGNINDPNSAVSKLKAQPINYALLKELHTKPRTTYQPKFRNPNPELENV